MENHKKLILKFKKTLIDIFETRFYQFLKENYVPKVLKLETDKNGNVIEDEKGSIFGKATVLQSNLPDIEALSYAFGLMRQFILKKDDISIYNIGKHIKALGTIDQYKKYEKILNEFEGYIDEFSGAEFVSVDDNGKIIRSKIFSRKQLINELFYGDIFHRQKDKYKVDDILSINKIVEYFLGFLVYICQIATIIMFPEEDKICYSENCPEKVLWGK